MSSSGSSEEQRRRRRRLADELEEGECVGPGGYQSSSDTEDYYNRDAALSGGESEETVSDDLHATAAAAAAVATASSVLADLYGRGGAYSVPANRYRPSLAAASHYGRARALSAAAAAAPKFPCRVCGKAFASEKAVCGHMKVHALEALHAGVNYKGNGIIRDKKVKKQKSNVEVAEGWGVTGRRGCSGLGMSTGTAKDSPKTESDHSMDSSVPVEPQLITPISYAMPEKSSLAMPEKSSSASMASARTSLSDDESSGKKPMTQLNDAMDIAGGKKPMTQLNDGMDIAEAAAAAGSDKPINNPIPPAEPVVVHQQEQPAPPPPPPPAGQKQARRRAQQDPAAPAGRQRPEGYTCKDPACGMWFSTHQALGGHAAAHKNRCRAAAAAAAGVLQGGAAPAGKPEERLHPCKKCSAVFSTGVQLGGHMRKHWEGEPLKPNKKPRLAQPLPPPPGPEVYPADLTLALPIKEESQSIAPAVDAEQPPAPTAAAAEGTPERVPGPRATDQPVILFGVDIRVKTPPAKEGSPASKDSSSASTGGEQQ